MALVTAQVFLSTRRRDIMIAELRAGLLLFVSLAFFLIIIAICVLSMLMKPDRWRERARLTSERRSTVDTRLSVSV